MPVSSKGTTIDPGIGDCVNHLVPGAAQHLSDYRSGRNPDQQNVVKTRAIETVLQGQDTLDLVRLDHCS